MKKILAVILASGMMLICGCTDLEVDANSEMVQEHFTLIQRTRDYKIYQHDATGVCYLVWDGGSGESGSSITIMLNADGTPYSGS